MDGWTNARCHNPSEEEIQKTIARVCAYPVGMLTGLAEATQLVLEARTGLRLSEMMGALRGRPMELAAPPWPDQCRFPDFPASPPVVKRIIS